MSFGVCPSVLPSTRPRRVEPQHPVTDRLQTDTANPRRLTPRAAVVDRGQRQQSTALIGVKRPTCKQPKNRHVEIISKSNWITHGKPPSGRHLESQKSRSGNPPSESHSAELGISCPGVSGVASDLRRPSPAIAPSRHAPLVVGGRRWPDDALSRHGDRARADAWARRIANDQVGRELDLLDPVLAADLLEQGPGGPLPHLRGRHPDGRQPR